jgi:glycosyltransferase involved in cell wall biosynthesis
MTVVEERATGELAGKRVAIVCGHFSPEIGYQEVDLARTCTRLGALVRVVTSNRVSGNARFAVEVREYAAGASTVDGYELVRVRPALSVGANLLGCRTLPLISEFSADVVILVGPAKLFGIDLFKSATARWRRIAIVQDNSDDGRKRGGPLWTRWGRSAFHGAVQRPAYRSVVRNADRIVLNLPETREIVRAWLRPSERRAFDRKAVDLKLGFDPLVFFLDRAARSSWRAAHGIGDDEIVLATCTRATPDKRLETIVDAVSAARSQGAALRCVLAGLLDDRYGNTVRAHVRRQRDPAAFVLLPMLRHAEMRELFSACDLGYWPRPAITIQQAMGTGLPVVLWHKPNLSNLVTPEKNGWYLEPDDTLAGGIVRAARSIALSSPNARLDARRKIQDFNHAHFSYERLLLKILSDL